MADKNPHVAGATDPDAITVFRVESDSLGQCRVWIDGVEQQRLLSVHFKARVGEAPTLNLKFLGHR